MLAHRTVIALDLDGVVFRSTHVKHHAMRALFDEHAIDAAALSRFILDRGGIPRRQKIAQIVEQFLGDPPTDDVLASYLNRYAMALEVVLAEAPLVDGVASLLQRADCTFYVVSSAPEGEVRHQLGMRGLTAHFAGLYASDTRKVDALRSVRERHPDQTVVFFGDSLADRDAARAARVAFVGVTAERDAFVDLDIATLRDFSTAADVDLAIRVASRTDGG